MSEFKDLGLSEVLNKALAAGNFTTPTPIQEKAIPLALIGRDIMGLAQTGTGKTLAFGLPMIDRLLEQPGRPKPKTVKALVLAPTRELVNQIADNLRPLVKATPMRVSTVVGGQSIGRQIGMLSKGTDILVATPGRLIDLMEREAVDLGTVHFLVLDEADQMLDLGFIHALRKIEPALGTPRQTLLFSATMSRQMEELSQSYLTKPRRVEVAAPGKPVERIAQSVEFLPKGEKSARLREILSADPEAMALVFSRTKHGAERLMKGLVADGYKAAALHGNKSQGQRDRAIKEFREGRINVLVATDVAARGIDIPGVAYVINYDLPNVAESYVHRIGRTARAGREGTAISFCSSDERDYLRAIEKLVGLRFLPEGPEGASEGRGEKPGKPGKPSHRRRRPGKNRSGTGAPKREGATADGRGKGGDARPSRPRRRRNRKGPKVAAAAK